MRRDEIGPGRLILVVGPSGAGKDTLITGARAACVDNPSVVFPRRIVTRPATADEDHDTLSEDIFRQAVAAGEFALWWDAHGLRYGIPRSIDDAIRSDKTVVCNVSRTALGRARLRYGCVTTVLVTAPPDILMSRLAGRQRSSDGDVAGRMARSAAVATDFEADVVIRNVGRPEIGIRRLLNVIRSDGLFGIS
ncbi:MAG: phosphonate metabolism protein/1,5-bisphosphokinase (PRPP-forming) PhnN [Xanthobacteraceae bacterium]